MTCAPGDGGQWTLRPAHAGDPEALLAVNAQAGADALPRSWLLDLSRYSGERGLLVVAESGAGVVDGFCLATVVLDEASLLLIVARPRVRREGLGRALLTALLDRLGRRGIRRCLLEVRESNAAALALYSGSGFVRDGRRRNYYPAGEADEREDAILMSWVQDHDRT